MPQPAATPSDPAALARARARALAVLLAAAPGDRLVVRAHHGDGARDALGELVARTPTTVSIATRRGTVVGV
ncbi:hypothetical protein NS330_06805, partial [Curtobacterium citreum]